MIVVHGRTNPICPFCLQAVKMLKAAELEFMYKDLTKDEWSIHELEQQFNTSIRTVPFITLNNTVIGGAQELALFIRKNS